MLAVIRLSPLAKNVAMRNRAGFKFTHEPMVADLTEEQLDGIRGDPYLKVCNHPSVAWFDALGIERTQANEDKWKKAPPTMKDIEAAQKEYEKTGTVIDLCKPRMAVVVTPPPPPPVRTPKAAPAPTVKQPEASKPLPQPSKKAEPAEKPKELSASSSVEDLVKALEKKGKKAGKDFAEDAKPDALFAMLKSL